MAEFTWITVFSLWMLTFTAAAAEQSSDFVVRDGDEVTLPAGCFRNMKHTCDKTTWLFIGQSGSAIIVFEGGKINEDVRTKSDRLSVTPDCSLVIKKVSVEDAGLYTCRQFNSAGQQEGPDSDVYLSVVNLTEQKKSDETILTCSVSTYDGCSHTVKWLHDNKDAAKISALNPRQSVCSASVRFSASHHVSTSEDSGLFSCQVKPEKGDMKEFIFRISPLRDEPGMKSLTTTTTTRSTSTTTTRKTPAEPKNPTSIKPTAGSDLSNSKERLTLRFFIVLVGLASLLTAVFVVNIWIRIKGKKLLGEENFVCSDEDNSAVTYENVEATDGV